MTNVEHLTSIPTLADLALKYGTICKDQHSHLLKLFADKSKQTGFADLLRDEGMVTQYQLELLMLIREYHIVRKSGEEFGAIAIEKGLATSLDINQALDLQQKEFKKSRRKKLIGDILVETRIITSKQKDLILNEQELFSKQYQATFYKAESAKENELKSRAGTRNRGIKIVVSSDHMTAWVQKLIPEKKTISLDQVKNSIMQSGIVNGVYPDSFIQCFLDSGVEKFPIARVDCYNMLKRKSCLDLYINGDNRKPLEKKKGEILTKQADTIIKIQAENLFGQNINAVAENDFTVRCGVNTRLSRDELKIVAVKSGIPSISASRKVYIHPVVHILEDADQRYGPIESYANVSVSGTITGAYPITAGKIRANEIRGAHIKAIGDVHAEVGITETVIHAQGDVHAKYLHNCRIETFRNVYIKNEIIDSHIRCGGKLDSPKCTVIASRIYAKAGVILSGAGSKRSVPNTIVAGCEHHAIGLVQTILDQMDSILRQLEELKEEKCNQESKAQKLFKKMIELKTFHDKAKKKKQVLLAELKENKKSLDQNTLGNIQKLILGYDKRMNSSLANLKTMNASKKEHDTNAEKLSEKISTFSIEVEKNILSHEKTLFAYLEKSKEAMGIPVIKIKGKAYAGTRFGGVYQTLTLEDDKNFFKVEELWPQGELPELKLTLGD